MLIHAWAISSTARSSQPAWFGSGLVPFAEVLSAIRGPKATEPLTGREASTAS